MIQNPSVAGSGISIHALLTESDLPALHEASPGENISIHALLTESDRNRLLFLRQPSEFQSTLSSRRATRPQKARVVPPVISIHALLTESDPKLPPPLWDTSTDFNPRSPHGERLRTCCNGTKTMTISIHALLTESDGHPEWHLQADALISIHALLTESDDFLRSRALDRTISIHALLTESDSKYHQIGPIVSV